MGKTVFPGRFLNNFLALNSISCYNPTLPLYKKRIFQKYRIYQHFWKICLK